MKNRVIGDVWILTTEHIVFGFSDKANSPRSINYPVVI